MSFAAVRDQEVPLHLLRQIMRSGRVPHGLLFWGPEGVGKRLAAIEMAKAVNCTSGEPDACDACLSCRKIASGNHPDFTMIAPVKRSRIIDVETLERVVESASFKPFEGRYRVVVFQDADRMRVEAQNKFLKTLEEPPGNALFVLVTEQPRALLPTIRSRCQQFRFGALRPETVIDLLRREQTLDQEKAAAVAALSQGQMSRAFSLVNTDTREVVLDTVRRLAEKEDPLAVSEAFMKYLEARKAAASGEIKEESEDAEPADMTREDREELRAEREAAVEALYRRGLMEILYLLETWYRDALVLRETSDPERVLNRDQLARLEATAGGDHLRKIASIEQARVHLERFLKEDRVFRDLFFVLAA